MKYFMKLEGNRIFLSPMNLEDVEQYTKWMNDFSVTVNIGNASSHYSMVKEKEALEEMVKNGHNFAIVQKDNEQLIGNASIFDINHIHRRAEIGLFIGEEENRGKGYGREAIELLLAYGFKVLNLNNIMLKVFSFNERAIKAYKNVGFKIIGERRKAYFINGAYYNEFYMDMLAEEFESQCLIDKLRIQM